LITRREVPESLRKVDAKMFLLGNVQNYNNIISKIPLIDNETFKRVSEKYDRIQV
jgi:hypothetical protein